MEEPDRRTCLPKGVLQYIAARTHGGPQQLNCSALCLADRLLFARALHTCPLLQTIHCIRKPGYISSLAFTKNFLAAALKDGTINLHGINIEAEAGILRGHESAVRSIAVSSKDILASSSDDKTIRLWDCHAKISTHVLHGHEDRVISVAWSPNGRSLVSGSGDKTVKTWDAATGVENSCSNHKGLVTNAAWASGNTILFSVDRTVKLHDCKTGKKSAVLKVHNDVVTSVAVSPTAPLVAVGTWNAKIHLIDLRNVEKLPGLIISPEMITSSILFSPDGTILASKGEMVCLWDMSTVHPMRYDPLYSEMTSRGPAITFSLDGNLLACDSLGGVVKVHSLQ